MSDWYERELHHWILVDKSSFVLGQLRHFPSGWRLHWRPSKIHKFHEQWWPCAELEEAKAWGLAMIRMQ